MLGTFPALAAALSSDVSDEFLPGPQIGRPESPTRALQLQVKNTLTNLPARDPSTSRRGDFPLSGLRRRCPSPSPSPSPCITAAVISMAAAVPITCKTQRRLVLQAKLKVPSSREFADSCTHAEPAEPAESACRASSRVSQVHSSYQPSSASCLHTRHHRRQDLKPAASPATPNKSQPAAKHGAEPRATASQART